MASGTHLLMAATVSSPLMPVTSRVRSLATMRGRSPHHSMARPSLVAALHLCLPTSAVFRVARYSRALATIPSPPSILQPSNLQAPPSPLPPPLHAAFHPLPSPSTPSPSPPCPTPYCPLTRCVTGDGIPDLLLGQSDGRLLYLPNLGNATSPLFPASADGCWVHGHPAEPEPEPEPAPGPGPEPELSPSPLTAHRSPLTPHPFALHPHLSPRSVCIRASSTAVHW